MSEIKISVKNKIYNINNLDLGERLAVKYLFYRSPIKYIVVITPFLLSYYSLFSFDYQSQVNSDMEHNFSLVRLNYINQFVIGIHLSISLTVGVFLMYRWNLHKNSGSYGYWLSMGINRVKFMLYNYFYYFFYTLTGIVIGLILMHFFFGVYIGLLLSINLLIQLIGIILLIVGIGSVLSEYVSNLYIIVLVYSVINIIFIATENNYLKLYYLREKIVFSIFSTAVLYAFGVLLLVISLHKHSRAEFTMR